MVVKKVLIADDSLLGRISVKNSIAHLDVEITEAVDGFDTLIKIEEEKPDILFLDLLMPKLDGFQVLEELRKKNNKTPILVVSADIQNTTIDRCMKLGATAYLNKPIERENLDSALSKIYET